MYIYIYYIYIYIYLYLYIYIYRYLFTGGIESIGQQQMHTANFKWCGWVTHSQKGRCKQFPLRIHRAEWIYVVIVCKRFFTINWWVQLPSIDGEIPLWDKPKEGSPLFHDVPNRSLAAPDIFIHGRQERWEVLGHFLRVLRLEVDGAGSTKM